MEAGLPSLAWKLSAPGFAEKRPTTPIVKGKDKSLGGLTTIMAAWPGAAIRSEETTACSLVGLTKLVVSVRLLYRTTDCGMKLRPVTVKVGLIAPTVRSAG